MSTKLYISYRNLRQRLRPDEGATAVEYGLMVAGIAVLIIVAVFALGGTLSELFTDVEEQIGGAGG